MLNFKHLLIVNKQYDLLLVTISNLATKFLAHTIKKESREGIQLANYTNTKLIPSK